jgi:hypothetical protein
MNIKIKNKRGEWGIKFANLLNFIDFDLQAIVE